MNNLTLIFLFCCIAPKVSPFGSTLFRHLFTLDPVLNAESFTKFKIYTPENFREPQKFNISYIPKAHFNKDRKTIIVIHGFGRADYLAEDAKIAYFENGQHNVNLIGVDWTEGSQDPVYVHSAHRVQHVGKIVGKFIERAVDKKLINLNNVELIGHSLGAHASGFAGKYLRKKNRPAVPLIIGLDPAGPLFRDQNRKLQKSDAQKVIAIHTNSDFGHFEPLGDVDIYLNGGKKQPGLNDRQSHSFAAEFYRGLININSPLIGYRYSSFAEVEDGKCPESEEIKLFHGEPLPHDPLIYVNTLVDCQNGLMPEFKKLDPKKNPPPSGFAKIGEYISENCSIM